MKKFKETNSVGHYLRLNMPCISDVIVCIICPWTVEAPQKLFITQTENWNSSWYLPQEIEVSCLQNPICAENLYNQPCTEI